MDCVGSNQMNWVDRLYWRRYRPLEIKGDDYWYSFPFMDQNEACFKVDTKKNVRRDLDTGKSGNVPDFVAQIFNCDANKAQEIFFSFDQQKNLELAIEKALITSVELNTEKAIRLIATKQLMTDFFLCSSLKKKSIHELTANRYCSEAPLELTKRIYTAIDLKNTARGHELKNKFFEGNVSSKYVIYPNNSNAKNAAVLETFLHFLSYQTLYQNQLWLLTNFLVLNSFDFFERNLLLIEKYKAGFFEFKQ